MFQRLAGRATGMVRRRRESCRARIREDAGQALVLALIVVMMIGLLPTITFGILQSTNQETSQAVNYEAALAAAQAGLQSYRNLLDEYQGYEAYNGSNQPPSSQGGCNPAFTGSSGSCATRWVPVASSGTPPEWYQYTPDTSQLSITSSGSSATPPAFPGEILLTVIGKAGVGQSAVYRRIVGALKLSGAITDVYNSTYEQPAAGDFQQWYNEYNRGYQVTRLPYAYDEATVTVGSYPAPTGAPADPGLGQPYATALCQYDAYQPNAFVDWYSQYVSPVYPPNGYYPNPGTAYNTGTNLGSGVAPNPYYGPWYGPWRDPNSPSGSNYTFGNGNGTNGVIGAACPVNYWITGNRFNGPVYSQDELTTCGTPSFTTLASATPTNMRFPAGWPGTKPASGGYSAPYGYVKNLFGGSVGCSGSPSIPGGVTLGQTQHLPSLADQIASDIKSNAVAGCIYSGPTALRFYWDPSTQTEEMDVWSPLTKDPYTSQGPNGGSAVQCGATGGTFGDLCAGQGPCNSSNTQVQGSGSGTVMTSANDFAQVPVIPGEAIWVQSSPMPSTSGGSPTCSTSSHNCWTTLPKAESNAPSSGCIDPWTAPDQLLDRQACSAGDLMVGGVTHGGLLLGSGANIEIARSLVYSCALNGSSTTQPGFKTNLPSACQSSNDVTGLIADKQIWLSDMNSGTTCSDDYDMALNTSGGSPNISWSDMIPLGGNGAQQDCYMAQPIVDAAITSLQGFFEVQDWRFATNGGGPPNLYVNGNMTVTNAGQYGTFGSSNTGYLLQLNFDKRLQYDLPPDYLSATGAVWEVTQWVSCGSTTPNPGRWTAGSPYTACTPLQS